MAAAARESVTLISTPTKEQLRGKRAVQTSFFAFNPSAALDLTPLVLTGMTGFDVSSDDGDEVKIYQESNYGVLTLADTKTWSGTLKTLGNDLKALLSLDGKTSGAFNSTDGFAAALESDMIARGTIVKKYLAPGQNTVSRIVIWNNVHRKDMGLSDEVEGFSENEIPVESDKSPIIFDVVNSTSYFRVRHDKFAYSAGNAYVMTDKAVPMVKSGANNLPGTYDRYLPFVYKEDASGVITEIVGGWTYTLGTKTLALGTNIASGENVGVIYVGQPE